MEAIFLISFTCLTLFFVVTLLFIVGFMIIAPFQTMLNYLNYLRSQGLVKVLKASCISAFITLLIVWLPCIDFFIGLGWCSEYSMDFVNGSTFTMYDSITISSTFANYYIGYCIFVCVIFAKFIIKMWDVLEILQERNVAGYKKGLFNIII